MLKNHTVIDLIQFDRQFLRFKNDSIRWISFGILLALNTVFAGDYLWPTDASQLLSSTFGEYRSGHFHAGIDIKTWAREGFKVFAIDSGSVTQIRVSPYGYGRAVYFLTADGTTAVFGHLSRFNPEIEKRVRERQLIEGRYAVRLHFRPGKLVFRKGELLAFTGETGTGVPHLHFELRDSLNNPVNPFLKDYRVDDQIPPQVRSIAVSPLRFGSHVDGDWQPVIFPVRQQKKGIYTVRDSIFCWGELGLSISAFDRSNGARNPLAVYELGMWVDSTRVFFSRYDRFDYIETGQIEIQRDSRLFALTGDEYQKLYRTRGNTLDFYRPDLPALGILSADTLNYLNGPGDGRFYLAEGSHRVHIIIRDYWGNQTQVSCTIQAKPYPPGKQTLRRPVYSNPDAGPAPDSSLLDFHFFSDYIRFELSGNIDRHPNPQLLIRFDGRRAELLPLIPVPGHRFACVYPLKGLQNGMIRSGFFSLMNHIPDVSVRFPLYECPDSEPSTWTSTDRRFRIRFPEGAVYESLWGSILSQSGDSLYESRIYEVLPDDVPLKRSVLLQFAGMNPADSTLGIYRAAADGSVEGYVGGIFEEGILSASVRKFGNFAVLRDTLPPKIVNTFPKPDMRFFRSIKQLRSVFTDSLSGFSGEDDYVFQLDGKRLIVEYDPEENLGVHHLDAPLFTGEHLFTIFLRDRGNNITELEIPFTILEPNQEEKP